MWIQCNSSTSYAFICLRRDKSHTKQLNWHLVELWNRLYYSLSSFQAGCTNYKTLTSFTRSPTYDVLQNRCDSIHYIWMDCRMVQVGRKIVANSSWGFLSLVWFWCTREYSVCIKSGKIFTEHALHVARIQFQNQAAIASYPWFSELSVSRARETRLTGGNKIGLSRSWGCGNFKGLMGFKHSLNFLHLD